jgi:ATP-dependent Clp protease ATP-binding subunit ClpA
MPRTHRASLSPMLERFTERSRQVVALADEEARTLKHNYIGTEHILLGLLREQGLAARILESLDITVERVRAQAVRIVGRGEEVSPGQIPITPHAKSVLERALHEALSLGQDSIGTEHILLGLVRENEGVAVRILFDFDADSEKIRDEVFRVVGAALIESSSHQGRVSEPPPLPLGDQLLAPPSDVALGWRRRPIALAALGAAVLARVAFDRSKTGHLEALEVQVLARLTLGPPDAPPANQASCLSH